MRAHGIGDEYHTEVRVLLVEDGPEERLVFAVGGVIVPGVDHNAKGQLLWVFVNLVSELVDELLSLAELLHLSFHTAVAQVEQDVLGALKLSDLALLAEEGKLLLLHFLSLFLALLFILKADLILLLLLLSCDCLRDSIFREIG